ncbi:MAG: DUF1566 domain-containing protein [Spirochaetaceae bacterium]|jgi:hypothetical protein|nr:DUF1566 domain-containing protein [Spirochaetaceae bacterium]
MRNLFFILFFLFTVFTLFAFGKREDGVKPFDIDPEALPRIGVAPFTALAETSFIKQDLLAIRNKVMENIKESGLFYVETNEYTEYVLNRNEVPVSLIYQKSNILKLRNSSLNYIVVGAVKMMGGKYLITLRLLDLDAAIFTAETEGLIKINGRDVHYGIAALTNRFVSEIDTTGYAIKRPDYSEPEFEYEVGSSGPGGGIIFYKKATSKDGWRYLELAPAETEFNAPWGFYENGAYGPDGLATELSIGAGRLNTQTVVSRMSAYKKTGSAAQAVRRISCGGFNDWFIPSKDEMQEIWEALGSKGLGNFHAVPYWTSSQSDYPYVWFFDFRDGKWYYNGRKPDVMRVRAIRAF